MKTTPARYPGVLFILLVFLASCSTNAPAQDAGLHADFPGIDASPDGSPPCGTDSPPDAPPCTCIPVSSWPPKWKSCDGAEVKWGCSHSPQTFGQRSDIWPWCWTTEIDKATGCPKPKITCWGRCGVPDRGVDLPVQVKDSGKAE